MPMKSSCTILTILAVLLVGCTPSNRPAGLPPLHPCTITITQNGSPLADVSVWLVATEPSEWPSTGVTDASGQAMIVTFGQFRGAPIGEYAVVLSKTVSEFNGTRGPDGEIVSGKTEFFSLVAVEYTKSETSVLKMTVVKGNNVQTFEIGEPVRILVDTIRPGE